ncbi:acyltransferase family protein [Streptomyces sp. BE303]|uniref:acyltransferase family protein n=1 Tax=Streptomyces sp. BE303 TaxID=3002528 RepID=UPI002E798F94|nr:acyltransferase family protein [Streptomyces sp. BE303]MED7954461.1 acyltransferase family protein [Streptomyces sp. BE303]
MHDGPSLGAPSAASGPTLQDMREARGIPAPRGSRYAVPAPPPEPPRPLPPSVRFASVDGLRGLAIASVLLYHTNWFQNGLFGVDAFFVLSGFLVTLVLIRELDRTDRIALGVFYRRRAKRLLPGLLATVFLVVALSALVSPLKDVKELRPQALAALAQVANWAQLERGDAYWQHYAGIDPLAAMWSLSITEQFYVVWPLLLLLIHAVCRRSLTATGIATGVLFVLSAAVAPLMWNGSNADRLYLGTETRAVGFAAGAAAAFVVYLRLRRKAADGAGAGPRTQRRFRAASGPAGTALLTLLGTATLGGLVAASLTVHDYKQPWLYQGGLAAVAALSAVLVASLCHDRGPLVRLLSLPPLRLTGTISYSLYLLHLPVYWMLQRFVDDISPPMLLAIGAPLSWVLAWLLHTATERVRVMRWRPFPTVPILAATTAVATVGAWYLPAWVSYDMRSGSAGRPLVLALGDSFSQDLATGLYRHGDRFRVVDGGISGCGVFGAERVRGTSKEEFDTTDECRDRTGRWERDLGRTGAQAVVLHLGWDAAEQYLDGTWLNPCDEYYRTRYGTQLAEAVGLIRQRAGDAKVLLMNERVENGAINKTWGTCYNQQVAEFVRGSAGTVQLLDLNAFYCPDGTCLWKDRDGHLVSPATDGVHLTPAGMRVVTPWLEQQISDALAGVRADGPPPATPQATPGGQPGTPAPAPAQAPAQTASPAATGQPTPTPTGQSTPTGRATGTTQPPAAGKPSTSTSPSAKPQP